MWLKAGLIDTNHQKVFIYSCDWKWQVYLALITNYHLFWEAEMESLIHTYHQ